MELLEFLNKNISKDNTVLEVIDIFEEMCKIPMRYDSLMLTYGVCDFTDEGLFYFDLIRQFQGEAGESYQLIVSLIFKEDDDNCDLCEALYSENTDENFFEYIRHSFGYEYAKDNQFIDVKIQLEKR